MIVYRIEHPEDGMGPYKGLNECVNWQETPHDESARTPVPVYDFDDKYWPYIMNEYLIFGFKSIRQLANWFTKTELETIFSYGYTIVTFESNNVIEGKNQVAVRI